MVSDSEERGTGGLARGGKTRVGRDNAEPEGGRNGGLSVGEGDGASAAGRPHGATRRTRFVLADHHRRGLPRRERGDTRQNQESQPAFPCRQRHQGRFGRSQVPSCRGFVEQEKVARKIPSARSFKIMLMIF